MVEGMGRLLVTGGAGFIGTAIVDAALAAGWQVRILDNLRPDVHGHNRQPASDTPRDIEFYRGDVTRVDDLRRALAGVDAVAHEAAKVGLGVDFYDTEDYVRSNDLGTAMLLTEMTRQGIQQLVLASSMVIYGEGAYSATGRPVRVPPRSEVDLKAGRFEPLDPITGEPLTSELITEDAPADPRNVYAATKLQQEHLVTAWARQTGGRAALLRYHNVYGPGMPRDTPYAGVASFFRSQLAQGTAPTVYEDGGQLRDFVHVRDVANANVAALAWLAAQEPGRTRAFNVGSGTPHTIGEMAAALARHAHGPAPVITGRYRLGDVRHIVASSARLHAELDVPAPVEFDAGMREFANAPLRGAGT